MEDSYDVIFRGDIVPGATIAGVRDQLRALFGLSDEQVNRLFSGRPQAIKRNLDRGAAEKFSQAMARAGAVVELRTASGEVARPITKAGGQAKVPEPTGGRASGNDPRADRAVDDEDISIAPVGADVLKPDEKSRVEPANVKTDHLSIDDPGADVLRPEERRNIEDRNVDTSHLKVVKPE